MKISNFVYLLNENIISNDMKSIELHYYRIFEEFLIKIHSK